MRASSYSDYPALTVVQVVVLTSGGEWLVMQVPTGSYGILGGHEAGQVVSW